MDVSLVTGARKREFGASGSLSCFGFPQRLQWPSGAVGSILLVPQVEGSEGLRGSWIRGGGDLLQVVIEDLFGGGD